MRESGGVVVRQRGRAVGLPHGEVGARPVEDRHEVVAQHRHAELAHVPHALAVVLDEAVARRTTELDVLVNGNALDDGGEAPGLSISSASRGVVSRPGVADGDVVQRSDDSRDAWNLPNVLERDRIVGPNQRKVILMREQK